MPKEIQENMLRQATEFRDANTRHAGSFGELKEIVETHRGFVVAPWDGTEETEAKIKEETKATIRLLPFDREEGEDLVSGRPGETAVFARAYVEAVTAPRVRLETSSLWMAPWTRSLTAPMPGGIGPRTKRVTLRPVSENPARPGGRSLSRRGRGVVGSRADLAWSPVGALDVGLALP